MWRIDRRRTGRGRSSARTLASYVAVWAVVGTAIALAALVVTGRDAPQPALPPVRQPELANAVRAGGCRLTVERRQPRRATAAEPVRPGVYDAAPPQAALEAALQRGTVAVRYRPDLEGKLVKRLEVMQAGVPRGTILAPDVAGVRHAVAVAAYRRALTCPRLTGASLDALRLFRGRYLGSGPGR
jgi:hypothetical protein